MNLSHRDRKVLLLGGVVVAVLLVGDMLLLPWIDDWQDARRQIAQARTTLAGWESREQRQAIQRDRVGELFGPGVAAALPTVDELRISFPNTLQPLMERAGVTVRTMNPQPARALRELQGVTMLTMQIEARCQAPQLAQCLAAFSGSDQLILVDRLSATGQQGQLDVSMTLSTPARTEATP